MNKDNLTRNGEGSSKPDTIDNPNNKSENSDPQNKVDDSEKQPAKPSISEARLRANRENAQKSTGPKTARGKAYSRRNALKHGLLINRPPVFVGRRSTQNSMTCSSLQAEYGSGDVGTELLRESLVFEWCVPEEGSKHLQRLLSKQKPETEL